MALDPPPHTQPMPPKSNPETRIPTVLSDRINEGTGIDDDSCEEPQPDPTVHLRSYQYVSQFSSDQVCGITIFITGSPGDPDGDSVSVVCKDINGNTVFTEGATRVGVGMYQITLASTQTTTPGYFSLVWSFAISAQAQNVTTYFQVGAENPDYDMLPQPMKDIIQITWGRFADVFDSPQGGPHLQVYFQSNFSMGRLAQLLNIALGYLNTMAQPQMTYTLDNADSFPYWQWGPLLEQALYIETLKHLIRSYTEMPSMPGVTVSMSDRRDYVDRWSSILESEMPFYKSQLDVFKIRHMGLGRPKVLVSGGAYGNIGFTRIPGSAAPRGMLFSRFWF